MILYLEMATEEQYYLEITSPQAEETGEYSVDVSEKLVLRVHSVLLIQKSI